MLGPTHGEYFVLIHINLQFSRSPINVSSKKIHLHDPFYRVLIHDIVPFLDLHGEDMVYNFYSSHAYIIKIYKGYFDIPYIYIFIFISGRWFGTVFIFPYIGNNNPN